MAQGNIVQSQPSANDLLNRMITNQSGTNEVLNAINLPSSSNMPEATNSVADGANSTQTKEEDDLLNSDKEDDGINDLLSMTLDEKMSDK